MESYKRPDGYKFTCKGLNVARPLDLLPEGQYPVLRNVRVTRDGQIDTRPGTDTVATLSDGVYSIARMNSDVDSTWIRFIGAGGQLYAGQNAFTVKDTGYSGNPLSLVPFRPNQSASPWMYVGDVQRSRKFKVDGTGYVVGIVPPTLAPYTALGKPNYAIVTQFDDVTWTAVNASALANLDRFLTTINVIKYDVGTTGWALINSVDFNSNWQPGALITIGGEVTRIQEVYSQIKDTTIAAIQYDSGTTGLCSIVLTAPVPNLIPNMMVGLGAGGEWVRVLSVIAGKDGIDSFRCVTVSTRAVGNAVIGAPSFRVWLDSTRVAGDAITGRAMQATFATGTGTVTKTIALDLSAVASRPIEPDDYMHISLLIDSPQNLVEGRIALDIGDGTFTGNLLYKVFRASDLTPNVQGYLTYLTTQQVITQREIIDPESGLVTYEDVVENVTTGQFVSGNSQWTELKFKIADMIRVGSDRSKTLANVNAIRVQLNVTANTQLIMDAWWVGGTYAPDVGAVGSPLLYATRYRASATGAKSNPSPVTRMGINAYREQVLVNLPTSADAQVDKVDVFRFGGGEDKWRLIGSYPNGTAQASDVYSALVIKVNELLEFDNYQPFPVVDLPRAGVCNVNGVLVRWVSGDVFNVNWAPGSQIVIGGVPYTLYAFPASTTVLEIVENGGAQTNAVFALPQPLIVAKPLPCTWTFGGQTMATFLMAVGDPLNPGYLRWCKGNNPDAGSDSGNLEITSPSEVLMNGLEYDGRCFVASTERWFSIFFNSAASGSNQFTAQVVITNNGLYGRYAFVVTPYGIAWVGRDGIYLWAGGAPVSLTDETLYPLFPHGTVVGTDANGFSAVDMSNPDNLRLTFPDGGLWFMYFDTNAVRRCLRFDFAHKGWFAWDFAHTPQVAVKEEGRNVNTVLVGSADGNLSTLSASTTDSGAVIACRVLTPSMDVGDARSNKTFGDYMLDASGTISAIPGFNNNAAVLPPNSSASGDRTQATFPLVIEARNVCLDLSWNGAGSLYEWQPSYLSKPEIGAGRPTDWDNCGQEGAKFIQGVRLRAAGSVSVPIQYYDDLGVLHTGATLAVNQSTEMVIPYSFTPFIAHLVRFGAASWQYFNAEWIWEQVPEAALLWQTQETTHDLSGYLHTRRALIAVMASADVTMTINVDGVAHAYTIAHNNGLYKKSLVQPGVLKGLWFQYTFTSSAPFRLFLRDCELQIKPWGDPGYFHVVNPFGDISRVTGARI